MNWLNLLAALALLAVIFVAVVIFIVKRLMETDEGRLINQANKEFTNRPRVRAINE